MKHPALTRVLAILLVVLSLTMAAAGALGLRQAQRERRLTREDMERLRGRIEEYQALSARLEDTESYDALSGRLDERQQAFDRESSQHRFELNTFTATQYGVGVGLDAIDEAEAQFAALKARFERGLAAFRNGMDQADTLLGYLWTLYNTVSPILDSAKRHLKTARGFSAVLDSGGELRYPQVVAAYDELLAIADESVRTAETLRGLEPTLDALAAFDISSLTSMADGMADLSTSLGSFGDVPLDAYQAYDVEVDFDMDRIARLKASYDQAWAEIKRGLALYDSASAQAETELQQLTGMSSAQLRAQAQTNRDALAERGDEPVDPLERELILAAWRSVRDPLLSGLNEADAGLKELSGYVAQLHSLLSAVQGQLDSLEALMAWAQDMIAAAADALYQARAMIWLQMGKQREKEEELWERKDVLDREALALQQLSDEAEAQKDLEDRLRTLRTSLLSRDGIKDRADAGEELGSAAQAYLDGTLSAAEESYARRRIACLLMLFGAGYGVVGIPAAFETVKSRLLLVLAVLHCLGCAAGAEQILWKLGRGLSYSCIAVMGFALLQLLVSRPKKKKRHAKRRIA